MTRRRHETRAATAHAWLSVLLALPLATGCIRKHEHEAGAESGAERAGEQEAGASGRGARKQGDARGRDPKRKPRNKRSKRNKELQSLGYISGTFDPNIKEVGVKVNKRDRAFDGLNYYNSRDQTHSQLVDMNGAIVHRWERPGSGPWQHSTLLPNGDVIALVKDKKLLRLDKDSREQWTVTGRFHHDLWVTDDGDIYALSRRQLKDSLHHPTLPTVEDLVIVLGPDGQQKREISVLKAIERSPYAFLLTDGRALPALEMNRPNPRPSKEFDILHTNHVEVLDGRFVEKSEIYARGNLLVSPRNTGCAMILDGESGDIVWLWGANNLIFPHHPTFTDKGNLLIFNNGTEATGSQVLELNPLTREVVWSYTDKEFFSLKRGSNQRLPNGNTLITESDTGYVFEVDPQGDIVWQFLNPHTRKKDSVRMAIWRMLRFQRDALKFEFTAPVTATP